MKLKIVVVEDYEKLRKAICAELSQDGHNVLGLAMAEDIDDEVLGSVPDLYIVDLNLPGEDGLSLVRRIRASQPDARVVIISARSTIADRVGGYSDGADIYITKPVSFDELKAVTESIGQRLHAQRHRDNVTLSLHMLSSKISGPAASASLTLSEASLLAAFSRSPQNELEHWQVAEHLGKGEDINKENIEVKLVRLRKKLAKCGFQGNAIASLRGVGYRLCATVRVFLE